MKTNNSHESRSERAKNEERDSQGQFTSKEKNSTTSASNKNESGHSKDGSHRGENAKNEERDSDGRFKSSDKK